MASYNKVILVGRLGKDPEFSFSANGLAISKFSLAVDDFQKGAKTTIWFNVTAFDKLAETIEKFLKRGSLVLIEGKIQIGKWEDKEGGKHESWNIIASSMQMLESKESRSSVAVSTGDDLDDRP